jgi:hypothetical protein
MIHRAVELEYARFDSRLASNLPPQELIRVYASTLIETPDFKGRAAFGNISLAITKLFKLLRSVPKAWDRIIAALEIPNWSEMSLVEKTKALGSKLKELLAEGKKVLAKTLIRISRTAPVSIFFVPKHKAPGLTDLLHRLVLKSPLLKAALSKIQGGAEALDVLLKKYTPTLSRGVYAAVFAWIWLNVAELSWDIPGIVAGFTGKISLGELLASLPESGLGFVAAAFGLGYGALPITLALRLIWLIANHYISYQPGKGILVHWSKIGVEEKDEFVAA